MIDWFSVILDGPGRFRTDAEKPYFQTCSFNVGKNE